MSTFDFGVKVINVDGTPDSRYAFEGRAGFIKTGLGQSPSYDGYPVVANAACTLAARGGCRQGTLEIVGGGIDWPKLDEFQLVEFYWNRFDDDSKFFRGRISGGVEREGTGNTHLYKLAGGWDGVDYVVIDQTWFLGIDEGQAGTNSISGAVNFIAQYILEIPAGTNAALDITKRGTIETCTTALKALTITRDSDMKEIIETLEMLARGDDETDRRWCCGVDHNGEFYFVSLSDSDIALRVQYGNDHAYRPLVSWREVVIPRIAPKQIVINGRVIPSGASINNVARQIYTNPFVSGDAPTKAKPHPVYARGLNTNDDMTNWANGWFKGFGQRTAIAKEMTYLAEEPPRPWEGFVAYRRPNESGTIVEVPLFWDTAEFSLANGPVITVSIGDEREPRLSRNQGISEVRMMIRELSGVDDLVFPLATDETTPETPAPGGGGGGGGTGETTIYNLSWFNNAS